MHNYQPTFESKETTRNIEDFIDAMKTEFWKIFTPLMSSLKLYFEPLLTVIGVTALSNYYLYAIQNEERAVEG
ncbi:MAG: hypothetical protein COB14_00205 [Alphaproteobacteria bacterium]|nr:MAG: hypothetical protein COB14_00205 [Alphaproteobacteria bacterium]